MSWAEVLFFTVYTVMAFVIMVGAVFLAWDCYRMRHIDDHVTFRKRKLEESDWESDRMQVKTYDEFRNDERRAQWLERKRKQTEVNHD